jgi:hypothetical protein
VELVTVFSYDDLLSSYLYRNSSGPGHFYYLSWNDECKLEIWNHCNTCFMMVF